MKGNFVWQNCISVSQGCDVSMAQIIVKKETQLSKLTST